MVPDQTRDEGKTITYHSVQQQANLKNTIIFLTSLYYHFHTFSKAISLYRIIVMSVQNTKTCCSGVAIRVFDLPPTHTDLRSAL